MNSKIANALEVFIMAELAAKKLPLPVENIRKTLETESPTKNAEAK